MILATAVAAPIVVVTVGILVFSARDWTGHTPLSYGPPANIAEAAGMADGAEVLRRLEIGEDPNRVQTIRREVISSVITRVTALEAAVWSRHVEVVALLDRRGAIVGAESRRHLACIATDTGATDIAAYLFPSGVPDCEKGRDSQVVLDRSKKVESHADEDQ